jgi:HAD superfamily hydrolase (TIGR01484 family)
MYRLLAVDLDGTLLRRDHSIAPDDRAAIRELKAAGVAVTIITGRLYSGALEAARACAIAGVIGCIEGGHLVDVETAHTHVRHAMAGDVTAILRTCFAAHELAAFVFEADGIHHDREGEPYAGYVRTWSPRLRLVEQVLDARVWAQGPLAAIAIGDTAAATAAHAELTAHAGRLFSVCFPVGPIPGKHAVLVRVAGPTKGTALAHLCGANGCTPADAVAIGDWVNDVPMFEVAGRSFAMGDAPDAVRTKATDVLSRPSGEGGGIAEAVRRAWG